MNKFFTRVAKCTALASVALAAAPAFAETYDFDELLGQSGAPATASFATLTANVVGNDVQFTLTAHGLEQFNGKSPWVGALAVDGVKTGSVGNVTGDSGVSMGKSAEGTFEFRFDFTDKASRLSDNETMSWTWVGGAGSFDSFALRVNGVKYDSGATNTIWYGASLLAVPETASYALMLAGLGALGVVARRRKTR